MAVITKLIEGEKPAFPYKGYGDLFVAEVPIDLDKLNPENGDRIALAPLAPGTLIVGCCVKMDKPAQGTGTISATIGTEAEAASIHSGADLKQDNYQLQNNAVVVSAEDVVYMTMAISGDLDTKGQGRVKVAMIRFNDE